MVLYVSQLPLLVVRHYEKRVMVLCSRSATNSPYRTARRLDMAYKCVASNLAPGLHIYPNIDSDFGETALARGCC
jgi:hypothetical protein